MSGSALNPKINQTVVRFGLFELDLRAGELRKAGLKIKLQDQPLQILTMLLERPGEIVTREELQKRLWPEDTFVDFDLSLNSAVKKVRQALGDDSENPRFVETLYRRGYRFIGQSNGVAISPPFEPVPVSLPPGPAEIPSEAQPVAARKINRHLLTWAVPVFLIVIAAAIWLTWPARAPRVLCYTQITHDGLRKLAMVTDGERLYIEELQGDHFGPVQVSVHGGESSPVAIPFANTFISDIAADGSGLVINLKGTYESSALWAVPLPTGPPQRLNDASGQSAVWSATRDKIFFANGPDLFVAGGNGSNPRKLTTLSGPVDRIRVSPDGDRLRFDVLDSRTGSTAIWETSIDGSHPHQLLANWNATPRECCGTWTPDGKYYVFQSLRDGKTNLWVLSEQSHWFAMVKPVQLTNGPLDFLSPVASKDGKKIFAIGSQPRTELLRYDGAAGYASFLGISASDPAFSRDGQWVAYVSIPEQTLWRAKADGAQRLQLTESSLQAALPRWSPDGKQIVFMGRTVSTNWRAYVIASEGGAARELLPGAPVGFDPTWSPDGKSVLLALNDTGQSHVTTTPSGPGIAIVDVQTHQVSPLPAATQLFSPRWSPDGRYIAALTADSQKLVLLDRVSQQWTDLVSMPIGYPSWSHDGKYLYFDTTLTDDPAFFRVRISDHKLERITGLKGLQRFWGQFGSWTGLAPDDSPLLVRDISSQEVYALDWQQP